MDNEKVGLKSGRVPQVGVLADLCFVAIHSAQVSEYRDLWHPDSSNFAIDTKEIACRIEHPIMCLS